MAAIIHSGNEGNQSEIHPLIQEQGIATEGTDKTTSKADIGDDPDLVMFLFDADADPAEIARALTKSGIDKIERPDDGTALNNVRGK